MFRYGQKKPCFIYRLVIDNSLEKKIYDRQIGKQGTADRVVDELNPEARLSLKDVTSLVCDDEDDPPPKDFGVNHINHLSLTDRILGSVLQRWGNSFTKDPFQHDTLLLEGKDSRLSKAEKRMAQRLYEKAKMDGTMQYRRQNYSSYYPKMPVPIPAMDNSNGAYGRMNPMYSSPRPSSMPSKPTLSPPLQGMGMDLLAEALAQGKLVCKEMVLTKDVTIARNQMSVGSGETTPIVLPSGTRVKLIKTPKGIYMQTPEGKIFRIHSSAPATPASPASIAAALGMNLKNPYPYSGIQGTSTALPSFSGDPKSPLVEPSMLKRFRGNYSILDILRLGQLIFLFHLRSFFFTEMQQKTSVTDSSKQVISFNDKSALLAQIRQNLSANKGFGNSVGSMNVKMGGSSSNAIHALPNNSNLNHFAKQLATLAQKSAADLLTEVGVGCSQSDIESNSNSGLSPKRPSSLLDPKARALPSASLPKKVATVSPNVSKARNFTPNRPMAAVEPMSKPSIVNPLGAEFPSSPDATCPTPSALSALSALSASPLIAKPASFIRRSTADLSPDLAEFASKSETEHQSLLDSNGSGRSGLFDNLSLASQLEGFASCTTTATRPTAESLKDLLKTTNNATSENVASNLQTTWIGDQSVPSGVNTPPQWSDYPQWNNGQWNGASTSSSQVNWQWPQQQQQQQQQQMQPQQVHPIFGSANSEVDTSTTTNTGIASADTYNTHQYSNNFESSNQWSSNYHSATTAANATTYPSHSLPPAGHYTTTPSYFPTSYFGTNAPAYTTYPQTSQPGYASLNSNYHNQFSGHGGNDFTPSYSQPYPGSFSQ